MAADRILMLKLLGDTSSMDKSLRKSEGRMKSFGRSVGRWGTAVVADFAIQGVEKLSDAIGDAWTGFRQGEQASAQLGTTWKNLGLDGDRLASTIDAISKSTLALGTDDTEAIMAFNRALQATGGKPKVAMDRLRIAQNLVANGSAPNLNAALKLIQQAGKGSARVVDQFGLKSKTAGGRIQELGEKVKGAAKKKAALDPMGVLFNAINEDLEGIVGSLAGGDLDGALKSLGQISTDIATAWTTIYDKAIPVLDKLAGAPLGKNGGLPEAGPVSDAAAAVGDLLDKLSQVADAITVKLGPAWVSFTDLLSKLQPFAQDALGAIQPLVDLFNGALVGAIGLVVDTASGAFATISALLSGDWAAAWGTGVQTVLDLLGNLDKALLTIPSTLMNLIAPVGEQATALGQAILDGVINLVMLIPGWVDGAFASILTGLGEAVDPFLKAAGKVGAAIFSGITTALSGLANAIVEPIRSGLNSVIDAWNSSNQVHLDQVVLFDALGRKDTFGPIDIGFPDIPRLASGGIVNDPTLALIGESGPEAVVPLGRGGGMGSTYNIAVSVAPGGDLVEAGRQMVRAIQSFERRSGRVWRSA